MGILDEAETEVKTIFATVKTAAVAEFQKLKGVVDSFESTKAGAFVAETLETSGLGTKVANLISDAETRGLSLAQRLEKIGADILDDVRQLPNLVGSAESAALAIVATALHDFDLAG